MSCHLIWLDQGEFPVVPHPEDFINKDGDSTQVSDFVEAKAQTLIREDKKRIDEENIQGRGPDSMIKTIFGFFSLPVEMDDNKRIDFPLFTWGISLLCFLIHVYFTNNQTIQMFGFYPKLSLNGDWLNYIVNVFMHGDYFHLLSNLYFFLTFADNVEDYYGKIKFVLIILLAPFIINFLTSMISIKGNLPHIGLSGVITAIMVLYGFTFRNSRIAFLIPYFHFSGSLTRSMHYLPSFTWLRFKAKYVVFFYCIKDLLYYFLFEKEGATNISHSSHLAGAIIGMLIYFLLKRLESSSFELTTH